MEYSGAGGKLVHEKNQKQKISWHCPFKEQIIISRGCIREILRFPKFTASWLKAI